MRSIKKYLIIFLLLPLFLLSNSATAQRRSNRVKKTSLPYYYGATAGFNFSNLNIKHGSGTQYSTGYQLGGFFEYNFSAPYSAKMDVLLTSLGGENVPSSLFFSPNSIILGDVQNINFKMLGIQMPMVLKYTVSSTYPEIYLQGGITSMFIIKSQAKLERSVSQSITTVNTTTRVDVKDKIQNFQGGFVAGLGGAFDVAGVRLTVDFCFNYNVTDLSANDVVKNNDFRSKSFNFSLGVSL